MYEIGELVKFLGTPGGVFEVIDPDEAADEFGPEFDLDNSDGMIYGRWIAVDKADDQPLLGTVDGFPENWCELIVEGDDSIEPEPPAAGLGEDWNLDALVLAAIHNRQAEFSYEKATNPHRILENRVLRVEEVRVAKGGSLLVSGFDPIRQDYRVFRIDRIVGNVAVR